MNTEPEIQYLGFLSLKDSYSVRFPMCMQTLPIGGYNEKFQKVHEE